MKVTIGILWPSFLVGALANAIFFTLIDPADLHASWGPLPANRLAGYTIGFFAFWAIGACSSAFTCFLQRSATDVNRLWCPGENEKPPPGSRTPGSS